MQYQLPNGKVIYMSVEEYLGMSDLELHELANSGYGNEPSMRSFSSGKKEPKIQQEDEPPLDYEGDDDQEDTVGPIKLRDCHPSTD